MTERVKLTEALSPPVLSKWPRSWRRAFILGLPITLPILVAWWALFLTALIVGGLAMMLTVMLAWAVTPIVAPLMWAWEAIDDLWSFPDDQALKDPQHD